MFKIFCHRSSSLYSFPDSLKLMLKLLTLIKSNELNSFPKKPDMVMRFASHSTKQLKSMLLHTPYY